MNRSLLRTEKFHSEEGNKEFVLEYYLTQSQHTFSSGNINYMCYGAEIKMKEIGNDRYCEIKSADEIFSSKDSAIGFIKSLADNLVTPCTLTDIVSDMLTEALA